MVMILRPASNSSLFPYTTLFRSYDTPTSSGNANPQIANAFARLIARIQADGHPDFARRPFKMVRKTAATMIRDIADGERSEEHTSELQSQSNLVCRLLPEIKNAI